MRAHELYLLKEIASKDCNNIFSEFRFTVEKSVKNSFSLWGDTSKVSYKAQPFEPAQCHRSSQIFSVSTAYLQSVQLAQLDLNLFSIDTVVFEPAALSTTFCQNRFDLLSSFWTSSTDSCLWTASAGPLYTCHLFCGLWRFSKSRASPVLSLAFSCSSCVTLFLSGLGIQFFSRSSLISRHLATVISDEGKWLPISAQYAT